ncbi:DUF6929 family protein [Daejeonella oryzae]|uniref:DUF6929 family protein n=1 Tax=Daejeonella oryzae TaxID=1122943 RepID=UPI0012DEF6FA|nr:hypothetical protein [Daejeonella oryzae]
MKNPEPVFIDYKIQDNYPSGSTVTYLNGYLYIMGDDASEILVLNDSLEETDRIKLFDDNPNQRIPKNLKADIEASALINFNERKSILFFGSGSLIPHRDSAFLFNPDDNKIEKINYSKFYDQLRRHFSQLNIESAASIGEELILGIRANASSPDNFLVVATSDDLLPVYKRRIYIHIPVKNTGISGMDYDSQQDILYMTFSSENTSNAFDDGEIGESYLAIIDDAKAQLQSDKIHISALTKLSDLSSEFKNQKIEGVCLLKEHSQLLLVADDDKGNTGLFRLGF